jgi:two-component system, NarL family, sensor histidine kinase UhpB
LEEALTKNSPGTYLAGLHRRIPFLSIYLRIALGNSIVIIIGAVGGTLLTHRLTHEAVSVWLIGFFACIGTILAISVNGWIIYKSLLPFHELVKIVNRVADGKTDFLSVPLKEIDPDFAQISFALDAIVRQLEERNRQLRALSQRAIKAQEEERIRIARCLHDDTGQSLSGLIIAIERLENRLPEKPAELEQRLAKTRHLATSALEELRRIIYDLRPTILDDLGLVSAIRWYTRTYLESQGIQVGLQVPEEDLHLPEETATTLFRISQEAINNILRHARAQTVIITLTCCDETICLEIKDDGVGFDSSSLASQEIVPLKLGLLGMKERAELSSGELNIQSVPGQGTLVRACLPAAIERQSFHRPSQKEIAQ